MGKTKHKAVQHEWKPPVSIESVNDKTTRTFVRKITPNTHDAKIWYVYVCSKAPMITMGNGKKKRSSAFGRETRLLQADIEKMNSKYFILTWT